MLSRLLLLAVVAARAAAAAESFEAAAPGRATGAPAAETRAARLPSIRVQPDQWGDADLENIRKVLESAAAPFLPHFAGRELAPIIVSRGTDSPIVLSARGPAGETLVRLNVEGRHWAQFAFQFSHEFCHVLCRFGRLDDRESDRENFWLEESLCEAASLFALRAMGKTWAVAPPYPNWRDYAVELERYAAARLAEGDLPEGTTLAAWFAGAEPEMRASAVLRAKDLVVAAALLPLLEEDPARWACVAALPRKAKAPRTLAAFLADWRAAVPAAHRTFIAEIGKRLGVQLPERRRI